MLLQAYRELQDCRKGHARTSSTLQMASYWSISTRNRSEPYCFLYSSLLANPLAWYLCALKPYFSCTHHKLDNCFVPGNKSTGAL